MLSARPLTLDSAVDVSAHTILSTKTPGRKAMKVRSALQENAIHSGAKTVLSKKTITQTPFRPGTAYGKKPTISVSTARPLMDKTPFPNRVAAANFGTAGKTPGIKLSKLALLVPEPGQNPTSPDAAPLLRPSSTRRSLRGRSSGTFKTPLTKGDYWNVSPGDIEGLEVDTDETKVDTEAVVVDEDDEIEYMPPVVTEPPYEPPFEMPDYATLGWNLFQLGHGEHMDDTADVYHATDIEQQVDVPALLAGTGITSCASGLERLDRNELEDDHPFKCKPPARPITVAATRASSIPTTTASQTRPSQKPATTVPQTQSRSIARATSSLISAPVPGQTRTSALRAAKAAATANSAPASNPIRPTKAVPRPIPVSLAKRPAPATVAGKKPLSRVASTSGAVSKGATSAVVGVPPALPPRSRSTSSSSTTLAPARPRTGSMPGKMRPPNGTAGKKQTTTAPVDDLTAILEKEYAIDGMEEDFRFDV